MVLLAAESRTIVNAGKRIPLRTIRQVLAPNDVKELDHRLARSHHIDPKDAKTAFEIQKLSEGIESSFNFCCPSNGCGEPLDQIEGCNAATCSSEHCKTTFCYLCGEPTGSVQGLDRDSPEYQAVSRKTHDHVKKHSGYYWEKRPGLCGSVSLGFSPKGARKSF
jgi:hypothetical protein